ncbi:hypothetical protein [Catenulispora rubra]|nr:hypothetical protein [Catenulispora rubra]
MPVGAVLADKAYSSKANRAMRSDKLSESYEAGLLLASVMIWIRST